MTRVKRTSVEHCLDRIDGHVAGLQKMVEENRYCVDVLTQLTATRSALDALGVQLLSERLKTCVAGTSDAHPESKQRSPTELSAEVRTLLTRYL